MRGNAERVAVARLAVEGRVRGYEDAFDQSMVAQAPKEFPGGVAGALQCDQLERVHRVALRQALAQFLGEIGHGIPTTHTIRIKPVQQLAQAVVRLAPLFQARRNLIAVQ